MSANLKLEDELLWDPIYVALDEYSKLYDYDLRGNKVSKQVRFFEDPAEHIQHIVRDHQLEIIAFGTSGIISIFVLIMLKRMFMNGFHSTINSVLFFFRIVKQKFRQKKMQNSGNADHDIFAANLYGIISDSKGIYKMRGDDGLIDYECSRFAWEAIEQTGLAYGELVEAEKEMKSSIEKRKNSTENRKKRNTGGNLSIESLTEDNDFDDKQENRV